MCGIVCTFNIKKNSTQLRQQVLKQSKTIRHRGPDWSGIFTNERAILAHERLAIVDPASGQQPQYSKDKNLVLAVNGEIYNHREIRKRYEDTYEFQSQSDCEVILALYQDKGKDLMEDLNGIFAFALYDVEKDVFLIGRDHMGIIPLYQGWDEHNNYYVASELKALEGYCIRIEEFLPGQYYYSPDGAPVKWYEREWMDYENVKDNTSDIDVLRQALEDAVERQLMSDVPYGVLLSGGLDSSVISAIAKKKAALAYRIGQYRTSLVAAASLVCGRFGRLARPCCCTESGRSYRNSSPRN
jgi:asparagine synthase (glutamine-hydrolysing)